MNLKQRLEREQSSLSELLDKLNDFIEEKIDTVTEPQAAILRIQQKAMETYNQCLLERAAFLPDDGEGGEEGAGEQPD